MHTRPTLLIDNYKHLVYQSGRLSTYEHLENFITNTSGGRRIADDHIALLPVQGFDNNDFMFGKPYAEAARYRV